MEIAYFTPGQLLLPELPLAPYRPAVPAGALGAYLDAYTQTDDLVIDLFCQSPTFIREAVQAGRLALGLNVNRALLLAPALRLMDVEKATVVTAFTHLAKARKGSETLQTHIEEMYRTTCARCGAPTMADAFIWEREDDVPVAKRYRCTACDDGEETRFHEAPVDQADRTAVAHFERRGLSYWLLLDRAASGDAPYRGRTATLLDLYTPRNLTAISDLLFKFDSLTLSSPVRRVLSALMLDTFDRATSLRSPDPPVSRPRRLQRPTRFVEENVWRVFERALEMWRTVDPSPVPHAPSLEALLSPNETETSARPEASLGSFYLAPLSTAQAGRDLPSGCAAVIIIDPPRPDTVLWQLSALWCHWLWGPQAGAALTPFLSRRRLDKDWFWRGLRSALGSVASLLRPNGRLVCIFTDENPTIMEALTLATAGAGYKWIGWGIRPSGEARVTCRFEATPERTPVEADPLSRAVAEQVADASLKVLRVRGEPVVWPALHAAIYAELAHSGLLAQVASLADDTDEPLSWLTDTIRSALDGAPLRQILPPSGDEPKGEPVEPVWWLDEPLEAQAASPLSDRVELAVAEILRDLLAVPEMELHRRVCARFPGPQTPDGRLIRLCLYSYGDEHAPGNWRLRSEDDLEARATETDAVIADLSSLGQRLDFAVTLGVTRNDEWAVEWWDESGHIPYVFAVRTTAVLGDLLFAPPPFPTAPRPEGSGVVPAGDIPERERTAPRIMEWREGENSEPRTTPCLTLPGGRAVLVGYKLRHDPRLRQQVIRYGWQFLKFRHLRHLVREVTAKQLDRYAFQAALGLDPIVEQEEAQLSLW